MSQTFSQRVADKVVDIFGSHTPSAATERRVTTGDLPADGIVYIAFPASELAQVAENGIVASGAFFTFLPVAFTDELLANRFGERRHGLEVGVVAIDTSLIGDISNWRIDETMPNSMVVWGDIPAEAITIDNQVLTAGQADASLSF